MTQQDKRMKSSREYSLTFGAGEKLVIEMKYL